MEAWGFVIPVITLDGVALLEFDGDHGVVGRKNRRHDLPDPTATAFVLDRLGEALT